MAYPYPQITFKVVTVDNIQLNQRLLPDENRQNVIDQLADATVWMEFYPWPLKNGDEFTLYGSEAVKLYKTLQQLNEISTLEVIYYGFPLSTPVLPKDLVINNLNNIVTKNLVGADQGFTLINTPIAFGTISAMFTQTSAIGQDIFVEIINNSLSELTVTVAGVPTLVLPGTTFTITQSLLTGQTVEISTFRADAFTQGMV
jgi:hypothetical protein